MSLFMTLPEGLARVKSKNGTEQELQAKLMYSEVRAESHRSTDTRYHESPLITDGLSPIPSLFWENAEIDWTKNSVTKWFGIDPDRYAQSHQYIRVNMEDIDRLWPAGRVIQPEKHDRRNKGGRPATYDWAAAGGFLAAWQTVNGEPERNAALSTALGEFFEGRGKVPDESDLKKFVRAYLIEYRREIGRGH